MKSLRTLAYQWVQELEQLLCDGVVWPAEVGVELLMVGFFRAEHFDGNVSIFQNGAESLCLSSDVGVPGNMEN